jgi:transcriptional regulator with PAS, ATPase and Fis domain
MLAASFFFHAGESMQHLLHFENPTMRQLVQRAEQLATSDVPILLHGETGTGKNIFAEHIHRCSRPQNGLFLRLDCAELSRNLLESELFGHERGAFTGATEKKVDYLDMVCGGTLFLDEVENLDQELQAKLLNVLDTKQFWRVGGREVVSTEFRLISATNVNIQQRIQSGIFRKDFYHRIKGQVITIPPLRERREDIKLFVEFFLKEFGKRYNRQPRISREAMSSLLAYDWPGNIRELRLVLESVLTVTKSARIEVEHLPLEVQHGAFLATAEKQQWTAEDLLNAYAKRVFASTSHNLAKTAKILGCSVDTLKSRLRKMGLL